jgi:virulence-associated protein VagC
MSEIPSKLKVMETATVIAEGDCQIVRLPSSVHLPPNVLVRQEGESVVLEPTRPKVWPEGFFDSIYVADPGFERPAQGELPNSPRALKKELGSSRN